MRALIGQHLCPIPGNDARIPALAQGVIAAPGSAPTHLPYAGTWSKSVGEPVNVHLPQAMGNLVLLQEPLEFSVAPYVCALEEIKVC